MSGPTPTSGPFRVPFGQGEATERGIDADIALHDAPVDDVPYSGGTLIKNKLLQNGDNTIPVNIGRALTGGIVLSQTDRTGFVNVTASGNNLIVWTNVNNVDDVGQISVTLWAF